jgi:hypothetical protein
MNVLGVVLSVNLGPSALIGVAIGVTEIRYRINKSRHYRGLPHRCAN